jgi:hypothetical protein
MPSECSARSLVGPSGGRLLGPSPHLVRSPSCSHWRRALRLLLVPFPTGGPSDVPARLIAIPASIPAHRRYAPRFTGDAGTGTLPRPRGFAVAMVVFEKYGQHPPLNRQAER